MVFSPARVRNFLSLCVCSSLFFPAIILAETPVEASTEVDDDVAEIEVWDPIEPVNRGIHWFNDKFDFYLFEPVARGYDWITPDVVQDSIGNVFENLNYPKYLVSDLVQLKFGQMAEHTGRFLINSTLGVGGLFDVASEFGLEQHKEDFGLALAYHGVPAGPYLVLPIVGPSNLRDTFGFFVDSFLDPVYWVAYETADDDDAFWISTGSTALSAIHTRAGLLEAVEAGKEASLDFYLFSQSAYYQYREGVLHDGQAPAGEGDIFADEFDREIDAEFD